MAFMRAMVAPALLMFWWFVARTGGPGHPSYTHARWRIWQEQSLLSRYLESGE